MRKDFEGERPTFRIIKGGKEERQSSLPEPEVMIETARRAIEETLWQINPARMIDPHAAALLGGDFSSYQLDFFRGQLQLAHNSSEVERLGLLKVVIDQTEKALTEAESGRYYLVRDFLKEHADRMKRNAARLPIIEAALQIEDAEKLLHVRKYTRETDEPFIRPQPAWLDKRFK